MTNAQCLSTLLLDVVSWDLVTDSAGNIAVATPPYSTAQDVASAIKCFLGEPFYDDTQGIPYETQILGKQPPLALFNSLMEDAALSVPGVLTALCVVNTFVDRNIVGQVTFTTTFNDETQTLTFAGSPNGFSWTADSNIVTADSNDFTADG